MAAATLQVAVYHGPNATPTVVNAESGIVFNRSDDELAVSRVPVPANIPGSNYANYKLLRLTVTTPGTTVISNFGYRKSGTEPSGVRFFAAVTAPTDYQQCTGSASDLGNRPPDSVAALAASPDPNTPNGYLPVVGSVTAFDAGEYPTTATGPLGNYLQVCLGISHLYAGGPSAAAALPALVLQYDEA